ncbi:5'-methylthioadenosine nucleosidase [Mycoplasma sp. 'Moose RK']|uniref:5'-methylthioadenosine nucleosidase n=1 Tax=Mycoplasma sp. 'Moose RK' TaxID=2780095 RepID=UPI0018C30FCB|nr:5'-methylthioadenosine nucleosidase [Mycoplasma sp. 'Moose RK']MBG0730754.1 5'-methylthioadenosine nucleosidase [Mycoplasma sp. 'Moose RK']
MKSTKIKTAIFYADENEAVNLEKNGAIFVKNYTILSTKVPLFTYKNQEFLYVNSRIGLINATMFAQAVVTEFAIENLINYGSCGTNLQVDFAKIQNQLVFPQKFYLLDAKTPWYPLGQLPGESPFYNNNLLANQPWILGSSNSFIADSKQIVDFNFVDFFDMEAFAFAQISRKNDLKFYCIKYPSDQIEANFDLEKVNFAIKNGAQKAINFVFKILDDLASK